MNPAVLGVMIPIIAILGAFTMVIFLRYYQNVERMSMIERGLNPTDLKSSDVKSIFQRRRDPFRHVRIACTAIGIGMGLFIGSILRSMLSFSTGGTILAGCIFIFGGAGLLAGYMIQMSLQSKAKKEGRDPYDEEI